MDAESPLSSGQVDATIADLERWAEPRETMRVEGGRKIKSLYLDQEAIGRLRSVHDFLPVLHALYAKADAAKKLSNTHLCEALRIETERRALAATMTEAEFQDWGMRVKELEASPEHAELKNCGKLINLILGDVLCPKLLQQLQKCLSAYDSPFMTLDRFSKAQEFWIGSKEETFHTNERAILSLEGNSFTRVALFDGYGGGRIEILRGQVPLGRDIMESLEDGDILWIPRPGKKPPEHRHVALCEEGEAETVLDTFKWERVHKRTHDGDRCPLDERSKCIEGVRILQGLSESLDLLIKKKRKEQAGGE